MAKYSAPSLPEDFHGVFKDKNVDIAIVVSKYNQEVTSKLQESAIQTLKLAGFSDGQIDVVQVPGVFEIPVVCRHIVDHGGFFGIVCLGAVIQGETDHHDYINHATLKNLQSISIDTGMPITAGILTTKNEEQAIARAGGDKGDKGVEAVVALIETMVALWEFENRHGE